MRPPLSRLDGNLFLRGALVLVILASALYLIIFFRYQLDREALIDRSMQEQVVGYLRAIIAKSNPSPSAPGQGITPPGSTWISLFSEKNGSLLFRFQSSTGDLASRLRAARQKIQHAPEIQRLNPTERKETRFKVDLELARGPIIASIPILFAHSIVPGLDGLGLATPNKTVYLLPDDLFRREMLASYQPFFFMGEFRSGLDIKASINDLADQLGISAEGWRATKKEIFRFSVQSFIEQISVSRPGSSPVMRSRVPVQQINRIMVRRAVSRAADYVLRQLRSDGQFEYIYYPLTNSHSPPGDYSLPRHAGTTWFLSLAYKILKEPRYKQGAQGAMEYLASHAVPQECQTTPYACIGTSKHADLGAAALGVVAAVEYQQATKDTRFLDLARRLGAFLLWSQKDNGDFCHQYHPESKQKNCQDVLLYYSGEATFALAKLFQVTRDQKYVQPLANALDFLTDEKYDFFLGQFFISEDHWTCIAAEAAYEAVNKAQYARFCYEFAHLNRRAQILPGEGLLHDLYGSFLITPYFMPHNTPVGSRTEANVATYLLSLKRGEASPHILHTILRSTRYLLDQQISPERYYLFPDPEAASGGMMQTPIRANIRIDFVQHAAAAMARVLPLIPETPWPP